MWFDVQKWFDLCQKKTIFMIFSAKTLKKFSTIRKTKNILNDYNVHVSCHYLCFEESIEKMNYGTCLINKYERKFGGAPTNKYWRKICVFIIMIVIFIIIVIIVVIIIFVVMNVIIVSLLQNPYFTLKLLNLLRKSL